MQQKDYKMLLKLFFPLGKPIRGTLTTRQYVNTMKGEAISLREDNILRQCFVIQINTHKERRLCVQAWFQQKGPETVFR